MALSRRQFLALGGAHILYFGSAAGNLTTPIKPRPVTTDSAQFLLLTGNHGNKQRNIEDQNYSLDGKMFENLDAIFFEGGNYLNEKGELNIWHEQHPFFQTALKKANEQNIPILLGDINGDELKDNMSALGSMFLGVSAAMLADRTDGNITRKEFIDGGIKLAKAATLIWGFAPWVGQTNSLLSRILGSEPWAESLRDISFGVDITHPENILGILRNAVISEKLLWWSEQKKESLERLPKIAVIMGSSHDLISGFLEGGRKFCQDYLNIYPDDFLRQYYGNETMDKYFSKVVELDLRSSSAYLYEDPALRNRFFGKEGQNISLPEGRSLA